jgi:hypothetical protein
MIGRAVSLAALVLLGTHLLPALVSPAHAATEPPRVALVIGNTRYQHVTPLENPGNDARLIAGTLKSIGFQLIGGDAQLDLDKLGMEKAIRTFRDRIGPGTLAFFYYSGHGLQIHGTNYLVPVNANPHSEADSPFELVDVALVLNQMEEAQSSLNIVILDACRNNPFGGRGFRALQGGLAEMKTLPDGTVISFATAPDSVASDGAAGARDSPYTIALNEVLRTPGIDVLQAFNRVGVAVKHATADQQRPWISASPIDGVYYFAGPAVPHPAPPSMPTTSISLPREVIPPGGTATSLRCPIAGTTVVRNGSVMVKYGGPDPQDPSVCFFQIDNRWNKMVFGLWGSSVDGAVKFADAVQTAIKTAPGTKITFESTAVSNGVTRQFRNEVQFESTDTLDVEQVARPVFRIRLSQQAESGSKFEGEWRLWFDQSTGVMLRYSYAAFGRPDPRHPDWVVTQLRVLG